VGQKQHKTKENASVQEIFIEDGEIGAKENIVDVKSPLSSDSIKNNMKIEEQEIIDLEAIEAPNIHDDKAPAKGITEMNGVSESSGSLDQSVPRRKSSECDNINSNSAVSDKTVRLEAVGKDINIITENEGGKEAPKNEILVQEKDSQRRSVIGYHKGNHISIDTQTCKTDHEISATVHEPESGENEKHVDEDRGSSPELESESYSVHSEREAVSGITKQSCRIMAVNVENVTVSNLEYPDSGIHPQYEHGSEDINVINEIPLSHLTVSKGGNSVSESVKALELTSDKMADVTVVDDGSTSVTVGQKKHSSELDLQQIEHEGEEKQKRLAGDQNVTQKPEKEFADWNDVVDVSDSSQTSHTEIKIELSKIRRCDTQNKTSLGNNDDIEIVNIVDVKDNLDNEIVEVNNKEVPSASGTRSRRRKPYQNHEHRNAVKTEIQVSQNNITAVKPNVLDAANDAVDNVTLLSSMQNLNPDRSHGNHSKDISCFGRGKVTSILLEHDEVEITPSIIDISEEQGKLKPSTFKEEEANSVRRSEIEVVDLEDEDTRPKLSREEERMRILDTIPSMDGKFMIHVRVPDKDLLPPNACPQKKDYYIQKYRLSAPGIGGKLTANLRNDGACQWQNGWPLQNGGQINPWIQNPAHNLGGGRNMFGASGMWSNSTFPMPGPFVNQHYQAPFPGSYELQNAFHQAIAAMSVLSNPALGYGQMFGMPAMAPMPQHSRIPYGHRPLWRYQTRPHYHRPYYRRRGQRCGTSYYRTHVKLGRYFENQGNSSNDIIPLCAEDKIRAGAQRTPSKYEVNLNDGNDDDDIHKSSGGGDNEADDDVIECVSVSSPVEDEPMEWKSSEGERNDSNKNGIGRPNVGVHQKRKVSKNTKHSEPPKKLQACIDNEEKRRKDVLKKEVQNEESSREVLQQEDITAADVKSWRDFKTVMQVVVLDSSSEDEDDVHVVVDDPQEPEVEINKPLVQPEDCKDIGISNLFLALLSCCVNYRFCSSDHIPCMPNYKTGFLYFFYVGGGHFMFMDV
jgi:hypothetical protein